MLSLPVKCGPMIGERISPAEGMFPSSLVPPNLCGIRYHPPTRELRSLQMKVAVLVLLASLDHMQLVEGDGLRDLQAQRTLS